MTHSTVYSLHWKWNKKGRFLLFVSASLSSLRIKMHTHTNFSMFLMAFVMFQLFSLFLFYNKVFSVSPFVAVAMGNIDVTSYFHFYFSFFLLYLFQLPFAIVCVWKSLKICKPKWRKIQNKFIQRQFYLFYARLASLSVLCLCMQSREKQSLSTTD